MHDGFLYDGPEFWLKQEVRNRGLGRFGEIEEQMLDAWRIGIFIGFDTYDLNAMFMERGKETTALFGGKSLVVRVNRRYIVCHNRTGLECCGAKITIFV